MTDAKQYRTDDDEEETDPIEIYEAQDDGNSHFIQFATYFFFLFSPNSEFPRILCVAVILFF